MRNWCPLVSIRGYRLVNDVLIRAIRGKGPLGAMEAAIFSEHGFPRGSQIGSELFRLTRIFSSAGRTKTGL